METKAKWIYEKLLHIKQKRSIAQIYNDENKVLYLGEKQALHVKGKLSDFYKQHTQKHILPLVQKWAQVMNEKPINIKFRKAKRRWGSCSKDNELSFNTSLIQLPLECIEYIIVHELSHIQHKHHQKSFWLHVQKFMPEYRNYEKILKNYSPEIKIH